MPISDWKTIQEYEADLGHTRAQARYTNALAQEKEGEISAQKEFSQLAQNMPQARNLEEATEQLFQQANMLTKTGRLKQGGEVLTQAANISKIRTDMGKTVVEQRVKELEEQSKQIGQTAADAQALFDQAEASPGQADLFWNSYKMKLVDQGQPVDGLPQSYREARSGLQMMAKRGVAAADQMRIEATKLRDEETASRNKVLNSQSLLANALAKAKIDYTNERRDWLKKQGVVDDTNKEALQVKNLRAAFLKEWPMVAASAIKKPEKGMKISNAAGRQAIWDGDSWEVVGEAPTWWKKSSTPTPNLPNIPGVSLEDED